MEITIRSLIQILIAIGIGLQGGCWIYRRRYGGKTRGAQVVEVFSVLCWFAAIVLIALKYALHWI